MAYLVSEMPLVGAHAAILALSLVALYRYVDRSDFYVKSLSQCNASISTIRARIGDSLEGELQPIFERGASPLIVTPTNYVETNVSPVGSEMFRKAMRDFCQRKSGVLWDFGQLLGAKYSWCEWARILSWGVLALAIWEAFCVLALGLSRQWTDIQYFVRDFAAYSFLPTAIFTGVFFLCQLLLLIRHNKIMSILAKYDDI